jgi:hypothetical protein
VSSVSDDGARGAQAARELTERIVHLWELLLEAQERQVWNALGYSSWTPWGRQQLIRPTKMERWAVMAELSAIMLYLALLLTTLRRALRARSDLLIENLALRQQLAVYTRQGRRPQLRNADRRFWALLARSWSGWRSTLVLVQPDAVVRWHRTAWRRYWTWKSRGRGRGRPRIDAALREFILRIARENPHWGAVRIAGELRPLGFEVSARTVHRYRQQALRRPPSPSWRAFLRNHAPQI